MIRVLVVDDSPVIREFLVRILSSDSELQVIGSAGNGEEALEAVKHKKPDVITMDIRMPKMNGMEATRLIMETYPTPIVIVSGSLEAEEAASFRAIEAGALAVLQRPTGFDHPDHEATACEMVRTVKLMSEVKVVRRWTHTRKKTSFSTLSATETKLNGTSVAAAAHKEIKSIAIGASTGGPVVLQQILSGLPKDYSIPVLITQHIAAGFVGGFTEWLTQSTGFQTSVAVHKEQLLCGRAYVAPDGFQMGVSKDNRIWLSGDEPENGMRPSVSYLFRSVANVFGRAAVGVLLTGMGKDGADELKLMKEKGAMTIAQDEDSSIVHGMPGSAINLDAVTHVLSPNEITATLVKLGS